MEDAHISKFNIGNDIHLFGVFDGHGGIVMRENFKAFRQGSRQICGKTFY